MYSTILVLLYWKVVKKQEKFRLSIGNIFATLIVLCFFAADQFETYFSNTATARSNFLRYGIYTMQRYLQYDALEDKHLQHFDSWASTFGETVTAIELAPEGYTLVGR